MGFYIKIIKAFGLFLYVLLQNRYVHQIRTAFYFVIFSILFSNFKFLRFGICLYFIFKRPYAYFPTKCYVLWEKKEFRWKYSNNYTFNTFNLSSTYLKLIDVSAKFPVKWRIFSTLSLYFEIIFTFAGGF